MSENEGQKPRKILEIIDDEKQITRFYVKLNDERTKFMLYVVASNSMSDDDILALVGMFIDERDGLPLDGNDFGDKTH